MRIRLLSLSSALLLSTLLLLSLSSALLLSTLLYLQTNEQTVNTECSKISFTEFNCPEPPSFIQTIGNDKEYKTPDNSDSKTDQSWYQQVIDNIEKEEYNISYSKEPGAYESPNRMNNLRFIYHTDGFTAKTRSSDLLKNSKDLKNRDRKYLKNSKSDEWEIKFKVKNLESNSTCSSDFKAGEFSVTGNKASIEDNNMRIEYTNDKSGMRQDFIIKNRPQGEGRLRLNLSADTKLKMTVGADALMFKDKNGNDKMKYSSLKCWDANHRELRAYFEKNYEFGIRNYELKNKSENKSIPNSKFLISNSFSIVVNDEDAVYPITIDPLSTSPGWSAESNQAAAAFGEKVAAAGDVNGDGYSDVMVSAMRYDNGESSEGRVYVYHGSASGLSPTSNWSAEGNQLNANFGNSISTAGDVNGDGYSDVIIGCWLYDNGNTNEGKVFVYHGSPTGLSNTSDWSAEGNQSSANFGYSVSTAGDVNGDGYSDVIIGAYAYDNGQSNEGKVFGYYGSASGLQATENWTAESNVASVYFGGCVSFAGDVNGDGYSDVIISASNYSNGQNIEGKAFVYNGSAGGLSLTESWSVESNVPDVGLDMCVSTAGDVNGDGYSDVLVGFRNYDNGQNSEGKVFEYDGSSSGLSATAIWTYESNQDNTSFGSGIASAGDVNGDGYSDIIIGSMNYDNGQTNEGKANVFLGSAAGLFTFTIYWEVESDQADARYGNSVSTAGDVNGDGFSDVIVGAVGVDNGQSNEGAAYVYYGSASIMSSTPNLTLENNQAESQFGYSVSTAGDVNGDGYSDVIVGAPKYDNFLGRCFVYLGSSSGLASSPAWTIGGIYGGGYLGISVSTAGDVNGDGYSDVIVGASRDYLGGRAFVFYGSSSGLSATADWTATSDQEYTVFGECVSTAGDVNGDGYSDIVIGDPTYTTGSFTEGGKIFVWYGSSTGLGFNGTPSNADWSAHVSDSHGSFGYSVSSAGDVNGDGYADLIAGAYRVDFPSLDAGGAFVWYGSSTGLGSNGTYSNADWSGYGTLLYYGYSVSTAGDVNGDGYSEIIIGAGNNGNVYMYNGSSAGLSVTSNWTTVFPGIEIDISVSTAGDVNGDGYSDVVFGIPSFTGGQINEGKVLVYQGSSSGLPVSSNWSAESNQIGAFFGGSVCSSGDINGDGYSDIIAGAPQYDNGQTNEGRTFVYYGNGATALRSTVQQYEPGTNNIVSSGGLTGTDGQVRLNIFGRSPFGRASGKIVYELKENGVPFSGSNISNSTASSGEGTNIDLGISGSQLNNDVAGLQSAKEYKWRARVQYSLVNNPYQKFGPWKYYNNYIPTPLGNFRASDGSTIKQLNLTMLMQGFYNSSTDLMVQDTARVYLRNSSSPYAIVDSAIAYLSSSGAGTYSFSNAVNGVNYYLQLRHRNSLETWSKTAQTFTANTLTYNFTSANTQAFGNNMINADASPVRYAVYSGDVNQDGTVDLNDVVQTYNAANVFTSGYILTDLTGDNLADLNDVILAYNNSASFVAAVRP